MKRANERRQAIMLRANRNKLAMAIVGLLCLGVSSGAHAATVECTDTAGNPAGTAGSNAVACGDEAVAGGWAVAIGRRAVAGDEAVAIGKAARDAGLASVSIGEGASAADPQSTALGACSYPPVTASVAIRPRYVAHDYPLLSLDLPPAASPPARGTPDTHPNT